MNRTHTNCDGIKRRDFLRVGSAGLLGLTLPDLLKLEAAGRRQRNPSPRRARSVIMVWLAGGPATMDMWDLKPDAPAEVRGEFKPVETRHRCRISEHLPRMARVMDKVTVVARWPTPSRARVGHRVRDDGQQADGRPAIPVAGIVGGLAVAGGAGGAAVCVVGGHPGGAGTAGYLGTGYNPFMIEGASGNGNGRPAGAMRLRVRGVALPDGFSLDELDQRDRLLRSFDQGLRTIDRSADVVDGLDSFHRQALEILRSDRTSRAFDLGQERQALARRLRPHTVRAGCAARRLVEADAFVTISMTGWDTHAQNFNALRTRLLPQLDSGVDVDWRLERPGVVGFDGRDVYGRVRPDAEDQPQRRPGPLGTVDGVCVGGRRVPAWLCPRLHEREGEVPSTDACTPDDIAATIFHSLGIDPAGSCSRRRADRSSCSERVRFWSGCWPEQFRL